ncbi:TrbI/VirB10 family protein [Alcaligenes faecalis]|uniref:TrbI/VirB10 family protein n=1 Tax=Alcaligenes faecalis TaxID=511 RepID=UPI001EF0D1A2|nr:TrbI/VirB10 family protein [Alcaligenes faecalis]ULH06435.1 TrbI/VirB10 family protein [Alcaligenes faecalis]
MTDESNNSPSKVSPESVSLRAAPQRVTRLNRRTLAVLAGGGVLLVMGALMWSLQPVRRAPGAYEELYNVDRISRAEGLESLPRDYSQIRQPPAPSELVPTLGEPLPGDLGRPILRAEREAEMRVSGGPDPAEAERLARLKEAEEAARAPLFYKTAGKSSSLPAPAGGLATSGLPYQDMQPDGTGAIDAIPAQNLQSNKEAFARSTASGSASPHGLTAPRAPYTLMAGTVISAALVTGVKSDLPGEVIATVTEHVYDSATGQHVLIPQGSRLMGRYNSQVAYGQSRVQAVWDRVILPDTSSVTLESLPATDPAGFAGLEDDVDWHWDRILAGAFMTTLLGVAAELASPDASGNDGRIIIATRDSLQDSVNQVGQEMTRRNMNIQPTLSIRQGMPVRVVVNQDITMRPYRPLFINR